MKEGSEKKYQILFREIFEIHHQVKIYQEWAYLNLNLLGEHNMLKLV